MSTAVQRHLSRSGGRLACPHPAHRIAQVAKDCPSQIILPECAGQAAWLEARRAGIGGSEVGALIGVSDYETPFSVYRNKIDGGKDISELAAVDWGHRLEEAVARKTADEIGLVHRFAGGLWAHREHDHLRVTPDRFACRPRSWKAIGLIECKTAGSEDDWASGTIRPGGKGTGVAPLSYQAQVQWQLGLLGLEVGWLGCLVMSSERPFYVVEIHQDEDWFAEMLAEANRFWHENVLPEVPPMHNLRHPKTEELLKLLHPSVILPSVELDEDAQAWVDERPALLAAYEKAKADLDANTNFFRMMTGDAGAAYLNGRKVVSYPEVTTTRIDVTAMREQAPEIAERFTVRSTHRRLTVAKPPKSKPS